MSKKGFSSPLFGKRKGSAAPSISDDQEAKRLAKKAEDKQSDRLDVLRKNADHSRVASATSHTSRESATSHASSSLPPLAVSPRADISTLTTEKIKCATYLESRKLNSLQAAVHSGDLRKLKALVAEKGRDVNKLDTYHGFTALHLAVDENKYDAAVILMDSGSLADKNPLKVIDLNAVNREGRTALVIAVIRGFSDIVHLLVKRNASLNVQDVLGCTALHYAVCLGDVSAFKLLADAGAKTDVLDKANQSGIPLFFHAIKNKRTPIAEKLLGNISSADINQAYGTDKSTALHFAVQHSMISIVHILIEKGANPVALDAEKRKPVERIDYTDYDEDLVDFLTLTEMSMFGSVTSFVEEGTEAKSVREIISKSVASLVSPMGSQSQLVRNEHREPDKVEMAAPGIPQISEQEQTSSSFSVSHQNKSDVNTQRLQQSPVISYHDDELSVSDYGNDEISAEVHIVAPSVHMPETEKKNIVPDTNQLAPQEMDLDSVSVGPSVLSSSESQSSSRRVSDKVESFEPKQGSDASSQSASGPYASEIVLSDDESDEMMILPADDSAVPQTNIQTAIEKAICETEEFIEASVEVPEPHIQVQLHENANLNQIADKGQIESSVANADAVLEMDISPSSTAVSTEQEGTKDAVASAWPIDAFKSAACIETLQRELIEKNATIASLQKQINSEAAAFQSRLDSALAEQQKANGEQQPNLDRTQSELVETKAQLEQSQKRAQESMHGWQTRYANLEADLSQEQSHNSVLEFEMNDMFAKSKLIEKHAADVEKQASELQQQLKTKEEEIAATKALSDSQNERFIEQIALLQCEAVTLTDNLGATEKALENESESRRILESKLEEGHVKNAEIIEELTAAVDEVESLQKKVLELESKVSQLEQETQTAQTSHLENVHSQEQSEQSFLSAQSRLQQELEAKEKLQRSNLKLETDLSAMKTELAISKAIINSRDSQIESFRESLKDTSAHHAAQAMSDRSTEVATTEQSTKRATDDSIAKYYEAEISALNQRLNDEAAFRTAQKSESLQILTTITSLEDSLADIQSKYEQQSSKLSTTESLKNEALDGLQELRFNMEDLKSSHENQLKKRDDVIQEHLKCINSLEKAAQDLKSQLAVVQKEKADIKKLRDDSLAEFREKLSQLQNELQETQYKNVVEVESLKANHLTAVSQLEDMLSASKKEVAKTKQSLEAVNEDTVQLQKAVDAKNDYISNLEETVAQLEGANESLRSLNQSSEQNHESRIEEIATLKTQHEQVIKSLNIELKELQGKYEKVLGKLETEKRSADSLSITCHQLEQQLHELQSTSSKRISILETHLSEKESLNEDLKDRLERLQSEMETLKSESDMQNAETSKNLIQIRNHEFNEDNLRESLEKSQQELHDSTELLNAEKEAFAQFRMEREQLVLQLHQEIEVFQQQVVELNHQISEQCDQIRCNEQTVTAHQKEIDSLKDVILEFQTRKLDLETSLEAETVTKQYSELKVQSLQQKVADLETDMNTLRASLDSKEVTLKQMHDQRESMEKLIRHKVGLEQEVLELQRSLEAQTSARQVSQQHVQSLQQMVADLEAQRASMKSADDALELTRDEKQIMEKRIRHLEDTSATLESKKGSIEREAAELQSYLEAELSAREQQIQSLQQKVVDLQAEVDSLESVKESLEQEVLEFQHSLGAEQSARQISEQQVQLLQKAVVELEAEVEGHRASMDSTNGTLEKMYDHRDSVEKRIRRLEDTSASLEAKNQALEQEAFEFQQSLEGEQSARQLSEQQVQSLKQKLADREAEMDGQRASNHSTDDAMQQLHDEKQIMETRIRHLEDTSATLESTKESLEHEAIELKTQCSMLLIANNEVGAANEVLKLVRDELREKLNKSQFELKESENRFTLLSNDVISMTNRVDSQIIELESQRDELTLELSSLKRELEKTHSALSSAEEKVDLLETELSASQTLYEQILDKYNELKQVSSSLESENESLQDTVDDFHSRFERLESSLSHETAAKNQLQSELDVFSKKHTTCQEDLKKLILEVVGMSKTLDLHSMQQKSQADRIEADGISLENLKVELNNERDNLAKALEKIENLEAELNKKSLQLPQLENDASGESQRYLELMKKYELSVSMEADTKNQLEALERQVVADNETADAQKASLCDKLLELKSQLENASIEYQSRCDVLQSSLFRETNENSSLKAELGSTTDKFARLKQNLDESLSRESNLQQQLGMLRNAKAPDTNIPNNVKESVDKESHVLKLQLAAAKAEIERLDLKISKISTAFDEVCVENGRLKKESFDKSENEGKLGAGLETEQKLLSNSAESHLREELSQVFTKNDQLMKEVAEKDELIRQLESVTKQQAEQILSSATNEQSMRTMNDQRILSIQNEDQGSAEAWTTRLELLETQLNRYENERAILMAQQDAYQQEIAQLENDMSESEREFDAVILEKSELETTVQEQEAKIAQYVHDKEGLTNQIVKLMSELEEAYKTTQDESQVVVRLQKQHSEAIAEMRSDLERSRAVQRSAEVAHERETSAVKAELSLNSDSEAKFNSLKVENARLSEKVAALSEKCDELEGEKGGLEIDLVDLKYVVERLEETERDLRKETAELKNRELPHLERIYALELAVQKAEKEIQASGMELQASAQKLHESNQMISELVAEKEALTTLTEKNSVAIKDLESLSIYHQNELENMTSALKAETRKASKFEQISQQLSSLAHLPESSQRNDRNSASSQIESTETLAEEVDHTASKKSHKAYSSSKDGNVSAALRDLHLLMNQEVRAVVMKLTTLEDNINTDTVKMSTLIDEVNADQQVESDVKNIFTNVFGTQCERSIEAKSVLSSATKKTQSTLSLFEQDFVSIIADLEAKETRQKNYIADLESRCAQFEETIQELKLKAQESEAQAKESKIYIKQLEAMAADLESSLNETESQLSKGDRLHNLSFEREKAAREHFERAFESLQSDIENLKSQRAQDKAKHQTVQAEVFELKNTLDIAQKDLGTCQSENCRLNNLISNLKDQQMKENLGSLEIVRLEQLQMITTLKDQVFEGQEMLTLKDAECKQVRSELAKRDSRVKEFEDQREEMHTSLASATRKVSQLQEALKAKNAVTESLSVKLEEAEELLSNSQKDIAEQGATILKMNKKVSEITACMKDREDSLGKLQSKVIVLESNQSKSDLEVRLLKQELESVQSQNSGLKESLLARNKEIQHHQTQLQSYASKEVSLTHSEAANELLRKEILALKNALQGAIKDGNLIGNTAPPPQKSETNENMETLQKESKNLRHLLESKDSHIKQLESAIRSHNAEASETNGKCSSLEQSIECLNAQVTELKELLKTKDHAITQLKLKDLKQQELINQFEYEKSDLQAQLELLRAQVSHYTEAIETKWQPQHGSFQKRLNELSTSLQEATMNNSFLQNEIALLKTLQAIPGSAVPHATAPLTDHRESQKIMESLAALKLEFGQLRATLSNSAESSNDILQHEGLQRILESFKTALHTLSSKIHDAEMKNRVPAIHNHPNEDETTRFKAVKAELVSEIEALESKLRQSRRDHASTEDRIMLLEDKLQTSKNCTEQAQIDLQEAQHQLRLTASEIRGLKADRKSEPIDPSAAHALQADNVKLQDSLNSLKSQAEREIKSLICEVSEYEGQISKLKEELSQSSALTQRYEYHIQNLQWTLKIQTEAHEETKASLSHEAQTVRKLKLDMEEMQKKTTAETVPHPTQQNTYQVANIPKNSLEADAHRQQIKFWKKKVQKLQAQVEAANELYDSKLDAICSKLEQSAIQWHQAELSLIQAVDHTARDDRIRLLKTDLKSIIRSINA
ncbi:hypothetical protein HDU81_003541 [Chytriomyces hyalinus]|nr:hypothetical protein HDU81_003541 [Chytriomyces hyalinus]